MEKSITYMHPHFGKGRATVAIKYTPHATEAQVVEYAVAFCAPKDRFVRRIGRAVALGRLMSNERSAVGVMAIMPTQRLKAEVMSKLLELTVKAGPTWARKSAKVQHNAIQRAFTF